MTATPCIHALGVALLLQVAAARMNMTGALAAAHAAAAHANAAIAELDDWESELADNLANKSQAAEEAASMVAKVWGTLRGQHDEVLRDFDAKLTALGSQAMVTANATEFEATERAATDALDELKLLNEKAFQAMHDQLSKVELMGKSRAKALERSAQEASRQVFNIGMAVAQGQREAGFPERVYEASEGAAEEVKEQLDRQAESAAEHAEKLVEKHANVLEHHVNELVDRLHDKASKSWEAHKRRLHLTLNALDDARKLASESAKIKALMQVPLPTDTQATTEGKVAKTPAAAALAFLAFTPGQGMGGSLVLAFAMLAAATLGVVLRFRRSISGLEHPLLV